MTHHTRLFSRKKGRVLAAFAVASVLTLASCSSSPESETGDDQGQEETDADDIVFIQAVRSLSNPYHANWVAGGELYADQIEVEQVVLSDDGDSQKQLSQIKSQLATSSSAGKTVVLNVDPNTSADTQAIVRAVADVDGYVLTHWNKPDDLHPWDIGDNWVAHVSFDGRVSGYEIAKLLFEEMGGEGRIVALQGILDNVSAKERFEGLQKALEEFPDIELLDEQTADWDRNKGFEVTQTLMSKYGDDINGVWAANDNMALGALEALKAAGKGGDVPIVGVDAVPEALEAVEDSDNTGYLATVSSDAFWQGGAMIALGYQAATGEYDVGEADEADREFYGTQVLITKENAADYLEPATLEDLQEDFKNPLQRSTGPIQ